MHYVGQLNTVSSDWDLGYWTRAAVCTLHCASGRVFQNKEEISQLVLSIISVTSVVLSNMGLEIWDEESSTWIISARDQFNVSPFSISSHYFWPYSNELQNNNLRLKSHDERSNTIIHIISFPVLLFYSNITVYCANSSSMKLYTNFAILLPPTFHLARQKKNAAKTLVTPVQIINPK